MTQFIICSCPFHGLYVSVWFVPLSLTILTSWHTTHHSSYSTLPTHMNFIVIPPACLTSFCRMFTHTVSRFPMSYSFTSTVFLHKCLLLSDVFLITLLKGMTSSSLLLMLFSLFFFPTWHLSPPSNACIWVQCMHTHKIFFIFSHYSLECKLH